MWTLDVGYGFWTLYMMIAGEENTGYRRKEENGVLGNRCMVKYREIL